MTRLIYGEGVTATRVRWYTTLYDESTTICIHAPEGLVRLPETALEGMIFVTLRPPAPPTPVVGEWRQYIKPHVCGVQIVSRGT